MLDAQFISEVIGMAEQRRAEAIKEAVRSRYGTLATHAAGEHDMTVPVVQEESGGCCGGTSGCGAGSTAALYAGTETGALPESVTAASAGCGNPTAMAELREGETVLDLGSGGGIDCFLTAKQVGPSGRVIGVDMTAEMLALARRNAATLGVSNVEFRMGEIEALPVADASVDVILSNCVINLSTDKDRVLGEAYRVLRPGGRLRVSDMVLARPWSGEEGQHLAEWSGCVAGALTVEEYRAKLESAGFVEVEVVVGGEWEEGARSAEVRALKRA